MSIYYKFSIFKAKWGWNKDGHGGYFTGYDLLNGSNAKVGGFCAEGYIRKIARNKYNVSFTFVFNDIVDPNSRYRNDRMWKKIMKNVENCSLTRS